MATARQLAAGRAAAHAPTVDGSPADPAPACVVPPSPYGDPEWAAIGFNRQRSLWWKVERVEILRGSRTHVLIAQVRSEETAHRILASQRWLTVASKWRSRTHSNLCEPKVIG